MVQYRRNFVPGGTYFFTVALHDRRSDLLIRHVDVLRTAFKAECAARPFRTDAIVILPDHLHAIWTLPPHASDFSGRWRGIKSRFVRSLSQSGLHIPRNDRGEVLVWQRRFWEHTIRDEGDYERHVDYIHYNPVKHGVAECAVGWAYSSFHRFVERGDIGADWAGPVDDINVPASGEP
ncbi:MAG: transposase [Halofilum sp. (in: g-proteobacteria)]